MNAFIEDYREANKFLYVENYPLKGNQQLIFLALPPVQVQYPNDERIQFNRESKKKRLKLKPISFDLEQPTRDQPEFKVYGKNRQFFGQAYRSSVIQQNNPLEKKEKLIKFEEYTKVPQEYLDKLDSKDETKQRKKQKEDQKRKEQELRLKKRGKLKIYKYSQNKMETMTLATLTIQKYYRRWKSRKLLLALKKKKSKRENICKELLKTEEDYVNNLKVLKEVYIDPLGIVAKKNGKILTVSDFQAIFGGLHSIINLNEGLSIEIKNEIFKSDGGFNHHNKVSSKIRNFAPYLRMYRSYCSKYQSSLTRLEKLRKIKKFNETLEKMDKNNKTTKLGLSSYLIMPIQRIPRYKLLLRDLIKATEKDHSDFKGLNVAINEIEETAFYLNNAMKEIDASEEVVTIQKLFDDSTSGNKNKVNIHLPHRRFVKKGEFMLSKLGQITDPVFVHLFNDVLILSKKNLKRDGYTFEFIKEIKLHNSKIYFSKEPKYSLYIKINKDILVCKNEDEKNDWLYHLFMTIVDIKEKHKKKISNEDDLDGGKIHTSSEVMKKMMIGFSIVDVAMLDEQDDSDNIELNDEECIGYVKNQENPTTMLKYISKTNILGKVITRKPHLRKFIISQDETKLQWGSPNKSINESFILLKNVRELAVGQTTLAFKRNPKPSAEGTSFSLIYGNGEIDSRGNWSGKTLDLICQTKKEFEIWKRALRFLISDKGKTTHRRNQGRNRIEKNKKKFYHDKNFEGDEMESSLMIDKKKEKLSKKLKFKQSGDGYTWGRGGTGALGHTGEKKDIQYPRVLLYLLFINVKEMFCGNNYSGCTLANGRVCTWGTNSYGNLGHGNTKNYKFPTPILKFHNLNERITSMALGSKTCLFLSESCNVWGSGNNEAGQLGGGSVNKNELSPVLVIKKSSSPSEKIIQIAAGTNHFGAVTNSGKVLTWGVGSEGQLGHGKKEPFKNQPSVIKSLKGIHITELSLGCWHSMALSNKGDVYSWGDGSFGQLGIAPPARVEKKIVMLIPTRISSLSKIKEISSGTSHAGCISSKGECYMWGASNYGQLGNEKIEKDKVNYTPQKISKLLIGLRKVDLNNNNVDNYKFESLKCGANHSLACVTYKNQVTGQIKNKLFSWGAGTYGRLGLGLDESDKAIPVEVPFFNEKDLRSISAGEKTSAACCSHQWVPDEDASACLDCNLKWTAIRRRHHCRNCGGVFCGKCSSHRVVLLKFGFNDKVRVCKLCYQILTRVNKEV